MYFECQPISMFFFLSTALDRYATNAFFAVGLLQAFAGSFNAFSESFCGKTQTK